MNHYLAGVIMACDRKGIIDDVTNVLDSLGIPAGDVQGIYTPAYRIQLLGKMTNGYSDTIKALLKRNKDAECNNQS